MILFILGGIDGSEWTKIDNGTQVKKWILQIWL